jgi:hypothetical protein
MDIGQIRSLAQMMVRGCLDLRGMVRELTVEVEQAPWRGPDRDRFVEQWNSHHAVRLSRVADSLEEASSEATAHARRQEEASAR